MWVKAKVLKRLRKGNYEVEYRDWAQKGQSKKVCVRSNDIRPAYDE